MVYLGCSETFHSVYVRSFHPPNFLDKIEKYELYKKISQIHHPHLNDFSGVLTYHASQTQRFLMDSVHWVPIRNFKILT